MATTILSPYTVNGSGAPRFTVVKTDQTFIADYDFPRCNINGLTDESVKDSYVTELDSGRFVQDIFGYRIRFTLDYSKQLYGGYVLMLNDLLRYEQEGYLIYFNPRIDVLNRKFNVQFANTPILLRAVPSGSGQFVFMQDIVISLVTTDLHVLNWVDATNLTHDSELTIL